MVLWISPREVDGQPVRHIEIFLWREASITESGGSTTSAPALLVSHSASGELSIEVDDYTRQSSEASAVFREAQEIRTGVLRRLAAGEFTPRIIDPANNAEKPAGADIRPTIQFQATGTLKGPFEQNGYPLVAVTGRVFLSRGVAGSENYLEIQADNAVVFLTQEPDAAAGLQRTAEGLGAIPSANSTADSPEVRKAQRKSDGNRQKLSAGFGEIDVQGAYLEGDVLMTVGPSMVRASRLYYDFIDDRALILDASVRTIIADRNIPLYVRAESIRQLSTNHFIASQAKFTTSEFKTPHYHIGAGEVELINRSPAGDGARFGNVTAGSFRITDATLNVGGVPIAWWPQLRGTVDASETALRSLRIGYSGDFGAEFESKWDLHSLLGLEKPPGFDSSLELDYFTERGPAIGVESKYERENYFGLFRSYGIADDGVDSLGRQRRVTTEQDVRGRLLWRHREILENDWQLSLEFSYASDDSFLEEFFEKEFDNEKDQETLLHLKKQRDNWAFNALLQGRVLDFTTQTERLPDFSYIRVGDVVGERFSWFSENRLGIVRYRVKDRSILDWLRFGPDPASEATLRADSRQEVSTPIDWGPWRIAPFAVARGSGWDDSPKKGAVTRAMGMYGARGSMYLSRAYPDARSELFDISGLRHVIKPDFTVWGAHSNVGSNELFPFDETVERIDEVDGAAFGFRQRWQTRRGIADARRSVDVFTLDTEIAAFHDAEKDEITNGSTSFSRPENSVSHNYLNNAAIWRINDRTAILSEMNYDTNDGEVDIFNVSLAVERTPRFAYVIGYRLIEETRSNILAADMTYTMTEKHSIAIREAFDLQEGKTLDFTVAFIRRLPRWYTALSFELDEAEDDFGVSVSIWPEGIPQAILGSRRLTGLANYSRLQSP